MQKYALQLLDGHKYVRCVNMYRASPIACGEARSRQAGLVDRLHDVYRRLARALTGCAVGELVPIGLQITINTA